MLPFSVPLQDFRIIFPALAFVSSGILALCASTQRYLFLPRGHRCSYRVFVGMRRRWPLEQTKPGPEHTEDTVEQAGIQPTRRPAGGPHERLRAQPSSCPLHFPLFSPLLLPPPHPPSAAADSFRRLWSRRHGSPFPCCISSNVPLLQGSTWTCCSQPFTPSSLLWVTMLPISSRETVLPSAGAGVKLDSRRQPQQSRAQEVAGPGCNGKTQLLVVRRTGLSIRSSESAWSFSCLG